MVRDGSDNGFEQNVCVRPYPFLPQARPEARNVGADVSVGAFGRDVTWKDPGISDKATHTAAEHNFF